MSKKNSSKSTASTESETIAIESQALAEFNSKNYGACLELLGKLDMTSDADNKLKHMKAVAAFYKSDCRDVKALEMVLGEICGEFGDDELSLELNDNCCLVAYFNKAVVLFHMGKPLKALKVLSALLQHIRTLDDDVVKRMCILTANILLDTNQPRKAESVLGLMKDRLNTTFEALSADDNFDDSDLVLSKESRPRIPKNLDEFRWMLRYNLLRCKVLAEQPVLVPAVEETTEMLVLKAHQFYLGHDYQMAAKELAKKPINSLPNVLKNGEEYNTVIANNMGLIHFHVRHYAMAARFFQHAITFDNNALQSVGTEPPLHCMNAMRRPEILYNLGVAMLHLQRPQDAFDCFMVPVRIYQNNPKLWLRLAEACIMVHKQNMKSDEQRNILATVSGSGAHRKYAVRPAPIKRSSTTNGTSTEPRPTLEFANICLGNALTLVEKYEIDFQLSQNVDENSKSHTPSATAPPSATCSAIPSAAKATSALSTSSASSTPPVTASMSSSTSATSESDLKAKTSTTAADWTQMDEKQHCPPSRPLTTSTFEKLKCAVLAAYSYVEISLCEFVMGLKHARDLKRMSNIPDTYAMLANLYCAEALIMLDRTAEARAFLDPKFIAELKEDDFIQRSSADWKISSLDAAQCIMKYNLAVLLVLNNDLDTAKQVLATCTHPIVFNQIKILRMFIELEAGNYDNCRQLIRMDTPQQYY